MIKPDTKIKLRMEGTVNGHCYFVIEGDGISGRRNALGREDIQPVEVLTDLCL